MSVFTCDHCDTEVMCVFPSGGNDEICHACFVRYMRPRGPGESLDDYNGRLPFEETDQGLCFSIEELNFFVLGDAFMCIVKEDAPNSLLHRYLRRSELMAFLDSYNCEKHIRPSAVRARTLFEKMFRFGY